MSQGVLNVLQIEKQILHTGVLETQMFLFLMVDLCTLKEYTCVSQTLGSCLTGN
jgi:hypothetical protein